ncbi:MAG: family intrarane metalloprotease [Flavipsychrobacter sp.]|nr:family intrarane metalloprotease [Flavipsychrobacter sp.]
MKYFRTYPWGMQLLLFLLMAFTFLSAAVAVISSLLPALTGVSAADIQHITPVASVAVINGAILTQGVFSVFTYLFTAVIFAYLSHPRPAEYLGIRAPGKSIQWVLALLVMLGAMPLLMGIEELISHIDFGAKVKASQKENDDIMKAFMNIADIKGFVRIFIVMAIIPAIGEELFFRGVLMRFSRQKSRDMVIPIVFTAAVFAYAHSNIYGMTSIFLAGVLLAVIYNLTGSIWCSILAHLFFNGSQIVLHYWGNTNKMISTFAASDSMPVSFLIAGAVLFSISLYLLIKNKTPLPENWADNFTRAELSQLTD